MTTNDIVYDLVGLFGVAFVVGAYYLITAQKLTGKSLRYHVMNLCGAILILISLTNTWNTASVAIEMVWISISIYGIYRCVARRNS
ncbi:MAG: hypothetical protein CMM93_01845 [Rickettsiales bacterium]|nr:hypothetical protein [Rickettsiales bacterium]|tara:strand:+ start:485 stop:742 length:258 start_codon:yes stop_codon:yes gene_type:complete